MGGPPRAYAWILRGSIGKILGCYWIVLRIKGAFWFDRRHRVFRETKIGLSFWELPCWLGLKPGASPATNSGAPTGIGRAFELLSPHRNSLFWVLPPLSNSWLLFILRICKSFSITLSIGCCYCVKAVPKASLCVAWVSGIGKEKRSVRSKNSNGSPRRGYVPRSGGQAKASGRLLLLVLRCFVCFV